MLRHSMVSSPAPSCVSGSKVASKGSRSAAAFSGPAADARASSKDGPASHRKGSSMGAGGLPILFGITAWCAGDSRNWGRTTVCNGHERCQFDCSVSRNNQRKPRHIYQLYVGFLCGHRTPLRSWTLCHVVVCKLFKTHANAVSTEHILSHAGSNTLSACGFHTLRFTLLVSDAE